MVRRSPFHMVSAWATNNNLVLGQVKVSEKSNEITAIPKLLELITVKGCIVTIDAMGCQQDIATKIIEQEADYVLAVKENQKQLYQDIQDEFRFGKNIQTNISEELDHGRIETRKCSVISAFEFIENKEEWAGLKSIARIESTREFKKLRQANRICHKVLHHKLVAWCKRLTKHNPLALGN